MLLADNERVTVEELLWTYDLKRCRLVVLSACETAISSFQQQDESDELTGLATCCIAAGAKGAIGSNWFVDDLATSLLVAKLFELMYEYKLRPAEALGKA